jgi:hypothetical protein
VKEKMLQQIRNGGVKERGEIFFLYNLIMHLVATVLPYMHWEVL